MKNILITGGAGFIGSHVVRLFVNYIINNKELPIYGDGKYTRDWLFVIDHAIAIDLVFHKGQQQET